MKIKQDNMFTLHYEPLLVQVIKLPEGVRYIDKKSGKKVEGVFEVYEYIYNEKNEKFDTPFIPPHELVLDE
jgi:hypothetical protein